MKIRHGHYEQFSCSHVSNTDPHHTRSSNLISPNLISLTQIFLPVHHDCSLICFIMIMWVKIGLLLLGLEIISVFFLLFLLKEGFSICSELWVICRGWWIWCDLITVASQKHYKVLTFTLCYYKCCHYAGFILLLIKPDPGSILSHKQD